MRRDDVGQQRFAHRVFVDRQLTGFDGREQDVFLARALVFERALDRSQHRGLFEHEQRVGCEIIEQGGALGISQREPCFGNVGAAREIGARGGDRRGRSAQTVEHALA